MEWTEKYRPKSLDEMVLNPNTKKELEKLSRNKKSFILYGPAGCGKTCFVNILLSDPDADHLKIDVSNQTMDYLRNNLRRYCGSAFNYTGTKYVVFNECDKLSKDAQTNLKDMMDDFAETNRFAFITRDKVIESTLLRSKVGNETFKCGVRNASCGLKTQFNEFIRESNGRDHLFSSWYELKDFFNRHAKVIRFLCAAV